jgi:hypothetical protein
LAALETCPVWLNGTKSFKMRLIGIAMFDAKMQLMPEAVPVGHYE